MRFLMCTRAKGTEEEAEPVVVDVGDGLAVLHLDDGERLVFDLAELEAAITTAALAEEAA